MPEQVSNSCCRFCSEPLERLILDLGATPPCQSRVYADQLGAEEPMFPTRVFICSHCFLVQLEDWVAPEAIFTEYAYFSSYSSSWLEHARRYTDMITARLGLGAASQVVELASNDGYLLRNFVQRGIPCLGIEPADNVAQVARKNGVPTISRFFGKEVAQEVRAQHGAADLIIGNNVLAHVPDLNDFVSGIQCLLAENGVVTMEFPHLEKLLAGNQFDTIYHEHFSYFAFFVAESVFAKHGMKLFDVQQLPTHGGSLRIFACHQSSTREISDAVVELREHEFAQGLNDFDIYERFSARVQATRHELREFLTRQRAAGKVVVGYGASGKGNALLNYCGVGNDLLRYTVDANPHKQNTYTPGSHIPVYHPDKIRETQPDYVLILPWNLEKEISTQCSYIHGRGGQFVIPIPHVRVVTATHDKVVMS